MQRLKVSGAVRPIYGSLGVKRLISYKTSDAIYVAEKARNYATCNLSATKGVLRHL